MPRVCWSWSAADRIVGEAARAQPWKVSDAPADYIDGVLKAIAWLCPANPAPGSKRKLGQNRSPADYAGVREGLGASPDAHDQALAHLMR